MALKKIIPRSSGKREVIMVDYKSILTNSKPTKSLLKTKIGQGGRNNYGKITTRHQGSGHKRKYRMVDFKRNKDNIPGRIATVEYDPNRSAFIALVNYLDGEKRYILAFDNLEVGQTILSGDKDIPIKPGNAMPIHLIPEGTFIHNIELRPSQGGQMMRSAGTAAQILGRDDTGKYVVVRLASGETRKILLAARATIGRVGNIDHNLIVIGKAGRNRWRGIRPTVRGSAMNPNDHPHGGGEGRTPIGKDAPRTPWGKRHLGVRTRSKKKKSNALIVKSRHARK